MKSHHHHHHRQQPAASTTIQTQIVQHCTVPCRRSFAETRTALEAAVPLLDRTYQRHLDAGDVAAADAALRMLPTLNRFGARPRDFGPVLRATATATATARVNDDGSSSSGTSKVVVTKEAVQYEIGNPHKAAQMVRLRGPTALYAPIRVVLLREGGSLEEEEEGKEGRLVVVDRVRFEYDKPSSTMGSTGIREVDEIARGLDEALHAVLFRAAGLYEPEVERGESKL